jgi:TetR/AcrR family transcriptional regulator
MTAWSTVVPSRDELHEAKRGALLREAASAFTRKGFHAASLDDIAQKLGVTKAALYHYYPSKHALLKECFNRAFKAGFDGLARAAAGGGSARVRLNNALRFYLKEMIDELSCCVVLTEEHALLPEDYAELKEQRDRFEFALRDLIRAGIADGSIVPCDPKLTVFTILGAVHWVSKWFNQGGAWSPEAVSKALTDLLDRMVSSTPVTALPTDIAAD